MLVFFETSPGQPLKPQTGFYPNPHMGEYLINSSNVKNPKLIDTVDNGVLMLDDDGTLSLYATAILSPFIPGGLFAGGDYTWTTFTGGGPLNGMTIVDAFNNGKIIGTENNFIVTLNTAGTGLELYYYATGTYYGIPYSVTTPLFGGPLSGKTVADAVGDTHGVAGITFVGIGDLDLAFYDSINKKMVYYNHAFFTNSIYGIMTSNNAVLSGGGAFAGSLDTAMNSGRFLGIGNTYLEFIDDVGQVHIYDGANGIGGGIYPVQPLEGSQVNENPYQGDFVDTLDDGYVL